MATPSATGAAYGNSDDSSLIQLVTFKIGDEEFGVDILKVQEIIRMRQQGMNPAAALCRSRKSPMRRHSWRA